MESSGLLRGAADTHSHILYGVDDGIRTLDQSLAALDYLGSLGLKELWCTPHTMEDVPNTTEGLKARFAELEKAYDGPVELHLASEYMLDPLFEKHLEDKDFLYHRMPGSVLVETSMWDAPYNMHEIFYEMLQCRITPVLAHPERYSYMDMREYETLLGKGVLFQLNLPSVIGVYGDEVREKALEFLRRGWYAMCGSDCHRFEAITRQFSAAALRKDTLKAIERIIHNQ